MNRKSIMIEKNKFEYLQHWFPFINPNNFIFMTDKTKIKYDIGLDDREANLKKCDKKFYLQNLEIKI